MSQTFYGCGSDHQDKYKKDCYFYNEEHDMGATIPFCGYQSYASWVCPCKDCKHYLSKDTIHDLVMDYIKNKPKETEDEEVKEPDSKNDEIEKQLKGLNDKISEMRNESIKKIFQDNRRSLNTLIKKKKFDMIPIGPTSGDCTTPYQVVFDEKMTVREFIDYVLTRKEWGIIGIYNENYKESFYGHPTCGYNKNMLENELPEEYLDRTISEAYARGGWSSMDYVLTLV